MAEPAVVPYPAAARTLLHDTIVTALDGLVRQRGWSATTMADVARAAGVSRQTVYNEFGSRGALIEAYVESAIELLVAQTAEVVLRHRDDPHAALREAFALFLRLASDEPAVRVIVSDAAHGAEVMQLVTGVGQTLAGTRIAALIAQVWPQVSPDDALLLAGSLVRLAISHALLPTEGPEVVAAGVGRMLASFVDDILGR